MSQPTILITGATGNLGGAILTHLLTTHGIPASSIAVSTSTADKSAQFTARGVTARIATFDDKASLLAAFAGIQKLFFVSSNTFDNERRTRQHRNVVEAAAEAGVGQTWYSSLAVGGTGVSDAEVMVAHALTEKMLADSGIIYTSVREGMYVDAFPLYLNWYPTRKDQKLYVPADVPVSWASIDELGEATAKLIIEGGREKEIVLLSGPRAQNLSEIVDAVNSASGRTNSLQVVPFEEYVQKNSEGDEGQKSEAFFRQWGTVYQGLAKGEGAETSNLLAELLARAPKDGVQWILEELKRDPEYSWHQQYISK